MTALLVLAALLSAGQQAPPRVSPATVRGTVIDAKTSAPLPGARVVLVERTRPTQTDTAGRFEFTDVPPGRYTLAVSIIGYIFVRRSIGAAADSILDITLPMAEGTGTYQEAVTVTAESARPPEIGVSSQSELGSAALQDLRGVLADDPMRAVQALPGVATGDDFQAQFSVRGSSFRQVGVVIDGTPTPLLLHSVRGVDDTGSIAMINSDVLDSASLHTGPHPQKHGDWLGATLDFSVRDGSRDRAQVRVAASGTSASVVLEGPIGPRKRGTWLVSMRKSYLGWLVKKIDPTIDSTIGFVDLQAKAGYDLTGRQHVELLLIGGKSDFLLQKTSPVNGLNHAASTGGLASAAWRYTRSPVVFTSRVSAVTSDFRNLGLQQQELGRGLTRSILWRNDVSWFANRGWTIEAGTSGEWQQDAETMRTFTNTGGHLVERHLSSSGARTWLWSGWTQAARRTPSSGLAAGVRATNDALSGRSTASPWLLAERVAGPFTVRAGASLAHQFPDLGLRPNTSGRLPERARLADVGIEHRLSATVRWQLTAFRRDDHDIIRPIGEAQVVAGAIVAESTFPSYASTLDGRSKGVELTVSRRSASGLTGWIGYSYAHTHYRDLRTGEAFDGDFDQRHTLNVFAQQRISYRTALSAKLRIGSNFPIVGYFEGTPEALRLSAGRNGVRLPFYARLDVRANRTFTYQRHRLTLFAEVMNVLNRRNMGQPLGSIRSTKDAVNSVSKMIPLVPSVGILIEF
jgi:hypothetical protein